MINANSPSDFPEGCFYLHYYIYYMYGIRM